MSDFGFISPGLEPCSWWNRWNRWLPEKWRYLRGPLAAGELSGSYGSIQQRGWGWKAPEKMELLWESPSAPRIWQRLGRECLARGIKVVGLPRVPTITPPVSLEWPKLSDGNSLELCLFMRRFQRTFPQARLAAPDFEVVIIWEEGNLGLICARLLGRVVRFLTLVHPKLRVLEDAAALLMAETGVAARIRVEPPGDWTGFKIIIHCGRFIQYLPIRLKGQIYYGLFQGGVSSGANLGLPLRVQGRFASVGGNVAMGEAFLRAVAELDAEHWYGATMRLEWAVQIGSLLEKLDVEGLEVNGPA